MHGRRGLTELARLRIASWAESAARMAASNSSRITSCVSWSMMPSRSLRMPAPYRRVPSRPGPPDVDLTAVSLGFRVGLVGSDSHAGLFLDYSGILDGTDKLVANSRPERLVA